MWHNSSLLTFLVISLCIFFTIFCVCFIARKLVLRGGRCLFMEEGSFCLIGAAYPGSGAPMDKGRIPRDLFGIFWISLSIVISGQVFKR